MDEQQQQQQVAPPAGDPAAQPVAGQPTVAAVPIPEGPSAQGKLFVGQVPAVCTEDMLRPVFHPYGEIVEIKIMRDAPGGRSKGCAWVRYATRTQAQAAIDALHETHTIPPQTNTLQVRFADDKARTSGSTTAFVGNLPPNTPADALKAFIETLLPPTVPLKDVNIPAGKLFGFLSFEDAQDCSMAVASIQGQVPVLNGNQLRVQAARPRTNSQAGMAAMAAYYGGMAARGGMMVDPSAAFWMGGGGGGRGGGGPPGSYGYYGGSTPQQAYGNAPYPQGPGAYAHFAAPNGGGGGGGRGRGRGGGGGGGGGGGQYNSYSNGVPGGWQ